LYDSQEAEPLKQAKDDDLAHQRTTNTTDEISDKDRLPTEAFLEGIRKLISIETPDAIKKSGIGALCSNCEQLTHWTFKVRPPEHLNWLEIKHGATALDCPLCQLLCDCLPARGHVPRVSVIPYDTTKTVLQVGRLNGM
jgi:hypothetical protein